MRKIFYIMGKSSSGKDTLYNRLLHSMPQLKRVVLYTTRPIREGESNGVDYYYIGENQLQELQAAGRIIELREYHTVHGIWKYMTVEDEQFTGDGEWYLMIGTLESYRQVRAYYGAAVLVPLYIEVEDGERLLRAVHREQQQIRPRYAELCRRFLADTEDFSEEKLAEAGIEKRFYNASVEECEQELQSYLTNQMML